MPQRIKTITDRIESEVRALYLAYRHEKTPFLARACIICVVAYAISPIDLIPDFIPVIGYLDDLILLPMGIWLAIRMIPPDIMVQCRAESQAPIEFAGPVRWIGVLFIVILWVAVVAAAVALIGGWGPFG